MNIAAAPFRFWNSPLRVVALALACAALSLGTGCQRAFYRRQADGDAYSLISEKSVDPLWALNRFNIDIDPRSRMADPFNPDRPPMPPDDPAAHDLMHCVDGKPGWPRWHRNGDTPGVENPFWRMQLPLDDRGYLVLNSDDSVRTALLHSRRYQQELEDLYLSALDVSFERFRFDAQFFAGYDVIGTFDGPLRRGAGGESSSQLTAATRPGGLQGNGVRMEKLNATGGELIVGFANSMIWQFSGPDTQSGFTLLNFNFVQPLLRQAGRARVLERLTVSERALLGNVRAMDQFRREFYLNVTTGRDLGNGPQRRGGVTGGAGLSGFSGVGTSGFGAVGSVTTGGANTGGTTAGSGAAQAGGFLGLLQQQLQLRNQEQNVVELEENLRQQEQLYRETQGDTAAALQQQLQVEQARQSVYDASSRLLNSRNQYEATVDSFKITLGLPADTPLDLTDPVLDPFRNLVDESARDVIEKLSDMRREVGDLNQRMLELAPPERDPSKRALVWNSELAELLTKVHRRLPEVQVVLKQLITTSLNEAEGDIQKLREVLPIRQQELTTIRAKYADHPEDYHDLLPGVRFNADLLEFAPVAALPDKLVRKRTQLVKTFNDHEKQLAALDKRFAELLKTGPSIPPPQLFLQVRNDAVNQAAGLLSDLRDSVHDLQLMQAQARAETIRLIPVDITPEEAVSVARELRRDWMNARMSLVDSWRLIEFNANGLKSDLSLIFNGDVQNVGDVPFDLRTTTGRLQVGVQFDPPLTRLAERNIYRQALIEYQQARRNYYVFEDQLIRSLRSTLRTLQTNQLNFELRRRALSTAARQIVVNDEIQRRRRTVPPAATGQTASNTATRDTVTALTDLLNAQNDLLAVWVNYEVLRRSLDFEMGTMELTNDGLWLDPGAIRGTKGREKLPDDAATDYGAPEPEEIPLGRPAK